MEDEKGLRKIMEFMRLLAIGLLAVNIYYYCFGYFRSLGWTAGVVEHLLESFTRNTFLFKASWVSKSLAVVFLLLSCLGTRGRANQELKGRTVAGSAALGLVLLFGSDAVRSLTLGLIVHADRGSQYTSAACRARIAQAGALPSSSRLGNPYDNAQAEAGWGTLKTELLPHGTAFASLEEARL
ncbi:YWFCY domain-containing protein [Hymenobacter sp. NST-14]|uniref:YWFCY domain-containing protein n=1 Tax=Hymenobacter piscis TaxID=2839984 RepID=UPI001C0094B1|nr:YWFCY domain-containing protein [Hymenobacter piscis]MBT9395072.1 YWFCY domain-containing protein [Hymenobacter piscis]